MFRLYATQVSFDGKHFSEVWIDPHYEEKHSRSISDELILALLQKIGDKPVDPDAESASFRYYVVDIDYRAKLYRLILVRPADDSYLGVRNAYRRSK